MTTDVAISFVGEDRWLATDIAQRLRGRVNVWVYPEHQHELVGDRGVTALSNVFRYEAPLVVVLHRGMWGHTPWTNIERDAVEDRRLHTGTTDFVMFVRMDDSALPGWVPSSRIYGSASLGADVIVATIEHWLNARGGQVRKETPPDIARRLDAAEERRRARESFLFGPQGWTAAWKQVEMVLDHLHSTSPGCGCTCRVERSAKRAQVERDHCIATIASRHQEDGVTQLVAKLWRGEALGDAVATGIYSFDFEPPDASGWRRDGRGPLLTPQQLGDEVITYLLNMIS